MIISQSEAKAFGAKHFFTGNPCKYGHIAMRFTSCNQCVECSRLKSIEWYSDRARAAAKKRKWRAANPEHARETDRLWRECNPDKVEATQQRYRDEHPGAHQKSCRDWYWRNVESESKRKSDYRKQNVEESRARSRAWGQANKPIVAALARKRRARAKGNGGTHTAADVAALHRLQKGKCAYCKIKLSDRYHVDHVLPLALGGSNGRENLQILCAPCNQSKSAKHPITFAQSLGMLL